MSLLGNIPPEELGGPDDREIDLAKLPRCPNCGYIIYKVGKMRCPECGVPLYTEDIAPSQGRRAADEQYRDERRVLHIGLGLWLAGIVLAAIGGIRLFPISACFMLALLIGTGLTLLWCLVWEGEWHRAIFALGILWLAGGGILLGASFC